MPGRALLEAKAVSLFASGRLGAAAFSSAPFASVQCVSAPLEPVPPESAPSGGDRR